MAFNGELLRLARQYRGFTQRDLARALKVEPSTVSRVENGVIEPGLLLVPEAADILGFPQRFSNNLIGYTDCR